MRTLAGKSAAKPRPLTLVVEIPEILAYNRLRK
jgi:hypothetical protein